MARVPGQKKIEGFTEGYLIMVFERGGLLLFSRPTCGARFLGR